MTANIILAPFLVHMVVALVSLLFWQKVRPQKIISIVGSVTSLAFSLFIFLLNWKHGHMVVFMGNWAPPYGITFVVDTLSAVMVVLTSIVAVAVSIYSTAAVSKNRIRYAFYPIYHFLIMGLIGTFLTGDIFNMYVWFEIVIISSFVLLTLGGKKMQMEGAVKYMALNILASTIFLTAIGILYGLTGTLNIADMALKIKSIENQDLVQVTGLLLFVAFGIKSAVFPLYFWLPSSYHTTPSTIGAVFGGLLTKMGIYALLRVFTVLFQPDTFALNLFIIVAICTMITGALGMMNKNNLRKIFSYLIVCHIGYFIAGIGLYTEIAFSAIIFYIIHDIVIKSNIFMMGGIIYKIRGSYDLRRLGGLYDDYKKLSLLMAVILFSMIGIPPLSGFWPKIYLFLESLQQDQFVLLLVIIFASFITLIMMAKIWSKAFWKELPKPDAEEIDNFKPLSPTKKIALVLPVIILASVSLYIGFNAAGIFEVSDRIAYEMMHPSLYIDAVLNRN